MGLKLSGMNDNCLSRNDNSAAAQSRELLVLQRCSIGTFYSDNKHRCIDESLDLLATCLFISFLVFPLSK